MASTGNTPIQLYYSDTSGNVPVAANLLLGELAINVPDGKLFYKDSSNIVSVLASASDNARITAAFSQANSAYTLANTKYSSSGGTISGSVVITNDLNVGGNVYISGNTTTLSSNNLVLNDSIIYLANNNPANLNDIGFVGNFTSGTYQHTGLVRDATDNVWKLFSNVVSEPTNTVDFTSAVYDSLKVGTVYGNLYGNANTVTAGVYTTDTGTVTNTMLAGSIANAKLLNSSITIVAGTGLSGGGSVALGSSVTVNANTGSTTAAGILQLTDSVSSTSTTTAATPNSVRTAYNLANTANTNASNASNLTTGTVAVARLGSGTANSNTYLRGDGTWSTIPAPYAFSPQVFTATAGQTTFTISGGYTVGSIIVYQNGVKLLVGSDVTASNGTDIVLINAADLGDTIEVLKYDTVYSVSGGGSGSSISTANTSLTATANGITLQNGYISATGDSKVNQYILSGVTTGATETEIFISGGKRIPVSTNTTIYYTVDVVARRTNASGESAGFYVKGVADNFSGAVADVGTLYEIIVARDDPNYSIDVRANNTTKTINMYVTGVAAKTIRWVANIQTVEVSQ